MLSYTLVSTLALLSISNGCTAKPILWRPAQAKRTDDQSKSGDKSVSFNNYQGISSMSNFDNFYGSGNFDGSSNQIIVKQEDIRVCHSVQVEVLQQKLTVIREYVKRLVTEQVCETEVQTVVIEQFNSGMSSFSGDIRRQNGRSPSYDSNIAGMINKVMPNDNGDVSDDNLGFDGSSVGSNSVKVGGDNWNDATSPSSTGKAYDMAQKAAGESDNSSSSDNSDNSSDNSDNSSDNSDSSASSSAPASSAEASSAEASSTEASSAEASSTAAPSSEASSAEASSTASSASASASGM